MPRPSERTDFTAGVLKDGKKPKKQPNSIVAVIRGIISHWLSSEQSRMKRQRFGVSRFLRESDFSDVYDNVLERFPGITRAGGQKDQENITREKKNDRIRSMLEGLASESKSTGAQYYHIRAFSDYIGVSEGSLLLFARVCSIERRAKNPAEAGTAIREYLRAERNFIEELIRISGSDDFEQFTFENGRNEKTGKAIWIADVRYLKKAVTQFERDTTTTYKEVMARD